MVQKTISKKKPPARH